MKLGSLTKLEKRHKIMLKKSNDDIMPTNCDVITIFPIYGQFAVTWKIPDSQSAKLTFSLTVTCYLTKTENRTKKSLTQLSQNCFE